MTAANELSALIAKTVEEQTLSLDALRAVGDIRDKAVSLEAQLEKSRADNDKAQTAIAKRDEQIAQSAEREATFVQREKALAGREAKITELEKATAVAAAQFATLDGAFKTIFANRIVRETTLTTQPLVQTSPGGSFVSNYDTRNTIDRTEG